MRVLLKICLLSLLLAGCEPHPLETGIWKYQVFRVSSKRVIEYKTRYDYIIYLQTPERVYQMNIDESDFNRVLIGDTLTFFIPQ